MKKICAWVSAAVNLIAFIGGVIFSAEKLCDLLFCLEKIGNGRQAVSAEESSEGTKK